MNVSFGVAFLIAGLVFLGLLSQWLAWRVKLPAILFLLVLGILLGPILGWLRPDKIFGLLLFPTISLGVAIILFEGALSLRLSELRGLGTVIQRLLSLGVFSTWAIISVATHWLTHFAWPMAILFGAVTVVSGPTVITPILRSARPNAKIAKVLHWESIRKRSANPPLRVGANQAKADFFQFHGRSSWSFLLGHVGSFSSISQR